MKTKAKTAKPTSKKAPVAAKKTAPKKAVKSVVKAKTTVKKAVSAKTVKAAPKSNVKAVSKKVTAKPVAKTVSKKVAPKAAVKKAVKAPVKPVKATKKVEKSSKIAVKTVKKVLTQAKTTKIDTAKAVKEVKSTPKLAPKAKNAEKIVEIKSVAHMNVKPIIISMPENQNNVRANVVVASRPAKIVAAKLGSEAGHESESRPAYRPIQVINKPLAPVQPVREMAPVDKTSEKVEFKAGDYVVYPAHGVGEIEAVETQIIGGMEIKLYAIAFEKDRMRLKVPVFKAHASGLRRLSTTNRMDDALKTLQGRAQIRRAMWSRRAQEYETKINSGDPVSIAEVLRDLKRSNDESEQSYSERQIYQSALERLAREVAAVEKISQDEAATRLENMIKSKRARASSAVAAVTAKEVANA